MVIKKSDVKFFYGLVLFTVLLTVVIAINLGETPGVSIVVNDSGTMLMNGSFLENTNWIMNISFNNTFDAGATGVNVTEINITLPSGFNFTGGTNMTNTSTGAIGGYEPINFTSNTSVGQTPDAFAGAVLQWVDDTADVGHVIPMEKTSNVSTNFMFTIGADTPGIWNMTIWWRNGTTSVTENITIVVNDSTAPHSVNWTSITPGNYFNISTTGILANVTFADNWNSNVVAVTGTNSNGINFSSVNISLYDANMALINASFATSANTNTFYYVNLTNSTGLPDGVYYINATVQDAAGNKNWSFATHELRKITLDTTAPTVTHSCGDVGSINVGETVTCICSGNDTASLAVAQTSGVASTTFNRDGDTSSAKSVTETCTIVDRAGNSASHSITYTVYSSDAAPGTGGGGSVSYTKTVIVTENQFKMGYQTELKTNERARVSVGGVNHEIGVTKVESDKVTIVVSSTPQTATLSVGETRKFDVTGDSVFDISVLLNSINSGKADITIKSISEEMTEEDIAGTDDESTTTGEDESTTTGAKSKVWIWIVVIIIAVLAVAGGYGMKKARK